MNKGKIIGTILSAFAALIAAGKAILNFISNIVKLKKKPAASAA